MCFTPCPVNFSLASGSLLRHDFSTEAGSHFRASRPAHLAHLCATLCPKHLISGSLWDRQSHPNVKAVGEASGTRGGSLLWLLPSLHTCCCLRRGRPGTAGWDKTAWQRGKFNNSSKTSTWGSRASAPASTNHRGAHLSSPASFTSLALRVASQPGFRGVFPTTTNRVSTAP